MTENHTQAESASARAAALNIGQEVATPLVDDQKKRRQTMIAVVLMIVSVLLIGASAYGLVSNGSDTDDRNQEALEQVVNGSESGTNPDGEDKGEEATADKDKDDKGSNKNDKDSDKDDEGSDKGSNNASDNNSSNANNNQSTTNGNGSGNGNGDGSGNGSGNGSGGGNSNGSGSGSSSNGSNGSASHNGGDSNGNAGGNGSSSSNAGGNSSPTPGTHKPAPKPNEVNITVSVDATAAGGFFVGPMNFTFEEGANAYDALVATGVSINSRWTSMGLYVAGINGYAEKQHGSMSGWMYYVNGQYINHSCDKEVLSDGDVVTWFYVTGD